MKGAATMNINPPRPDFYTDSELAEEWGISRKLVIRYIETGKLNGELVEIKRAYGGGFVRWGDPKPPTVKVVDSYYKIPLAEVLRFEAEHPTPSPEALPTDNPKAVDSLLKLIAVMAVEGFGYNPKQERSPIPGEIVKAAERMDIIIDEKTVRKWLKTAASTHIPTDYITP